MITWKSDVCECVMQLDANANVIGFVNKTDQHAALTDQEAVLAIKLLCAEKSELHDTGFIENNLTVAELKQVRITKFKVKVAEYLDKKYTAEEKDSFILAGLVALQAGNTAKFNLALPVYTWILSVYAALKTAKNAVNTASTKAEVKAVDIDFAALNATKPNTKIWEVI